MFIKMILGIKNFYYKIFNLLGNGTLEIFLYLILLITIIIFGK